MNHNYWKAQEILSSFPLLFLLERRFLCGCHQVKWQ